MREDLEKILIKKYPQLFCQHNLPMNKTAMCWGIQCQSGWFHIIDHLCEWISFNVKNNPHMFPVVEFTTIKEKFGTARIYYDTRYMTKEEFKKVKSGFLDKSYSEYLKLDLSRGLDGIDGAVSLTESISSKVCETCGAHGHLVNRNNWYSTECDKCEKERNDELIKRRQGKTLPGSRPRGV